MIPLDPLQIPLRGLALIEASAGTGKTYTIATLYLRLLLERGLEVDRILVVTFTEAATEELRDRIRRRVAQALDWLQGDIDARRKEDPVLAKLLSALPDHDAARTLLTDALTRMDEAAVHTIHGFCLRMLQDNAFESGAAFDVEFITDETGLRTTAVEDFWRNRVAGATLEQAQWVRAHWKTPSALLAHLTPTLALDDLRLLPTVDAAGIEAVHQELNDTFDQLCRLWRDTGEDVIDILMNSSALKRQSYNKNVVAKAIGTAETLVAASGPPAALPKDFDRLTPAGLELGTKPDHEPSRHPFFDLCGLYPELVARAESYAVAEFLTAARTFVREALDRRKRDEGLMYFDDLLRRLDRALAADGGDTLAAIVRERYPVALIDEFQDTDPQQYRIFRKVYGGQPDCGLFLIGDPKQAIYAFRGADIFTYMEARDSTDHEGAQYTLGVNWRSSSRLVEAVNALFGGAHAPFIYEDYIRFHGVAPSPCADDKPLRIDGVEPVPLQCWMLKVDENNRTKTSPGFIRNDAARDAAAHACAERIAGLLNLSDAGRASIGDRQLAPGDIALLVRTHREGDLVQQALRASGVNSVSLSQDSVFESDDADELVTLLAALAELEDEGRVRAALATSLLGCGAEELDRLATDEIAWEALLARFQDYRERWRQHGVMVALQELLTAEQIPKRLLCRPDGERRLTNLLQLLELLQVASDEYPGIDALLRWLADQRTGGARDEARQLRLESDEGLVKVVTMHKCKGLEYPLVFIPFPWSYFKPLKRGRQWPAFFHAPGDKTACLDLGSDQEAQNRVLAGTEQLAERLRLFYVAVTRAARFCVLCWGRVNEAQDSALAYLLHRDTNKSEPASRMNELSEAEIRADADAMAGQAPGRILVCDLPSPSSEHWAPPRLDLERLKPRVFAAAIDTRWRVSSYSGLLRGEDAERPDYDQAAAQPVEAGIDTPVEGVFELPAGPHAGHFLHEVFENLDFPRASGDLLTSTVQRQLERYGGLTPEGSTDAGRDWAPVVEELVANVLDTWLDPLESLRLRGVAATDRLVELEFHFPVAALSPNAMRAVLAQSTEYAHSADGLTFEPMRGLMRGFIDLVFRHDGRYYVVDYKSNRLGNRLAAYQPDVLRGAIRHHRYDLQYLVYTLALHRYLSRRVLGYDYERHFGGVYYLFLRGMRPQHGCRYGVWHDRPGAELIDALNRLFESGREAA